MSSKLAHILGKTLTKWFLVNRNITQYSMPRTGSTLIRRILDELFTNVTSRHPPLRKPSIHNDGILVISCRYPLDVFVSVVRISGASGLDDSTLNHYLPSLEAQYRLYFHDLSLFKNDKVKLKYEKFWNNYDYIFDRLENFFDLQISQKKRKHINHVCGIKNTKKIQGALEGFNDTDEKTKIHGDHIATPEPFGYKKILTERQISFLEERLHEPLEEWRKL
jgi:hypothetical protein